MTRSINNPSLGGVDTNGVVRRRPKLAPKPDVVVKRRLVVRHLMVVGLTVHVGSHMAHLLLSLVHLCVSFYGGRRSLNITDAVSSDAALGVVSQTVFLIRLFLLDVQVALASLTGASNVVSDPEKVHDLTKLTKLDDEVRIDAA